MTGREVVVLGYGMAGARLAEEIRRRDPDGERVALTVIGEEPHHAYNRVLLSALLAGRIPAEAIQLHDEDWATENDVTLRLGVAATRIDRAERRVELDDGSVVGYDALVLATGSRPVLPPVEGLCGDDGTPAEGVVAFRGLDDCARIIDTARIGAPVAVIGGGLLGLEAARGLAGRGNLVTVVHQVGHLMERQLDPEGGQVLANTLRDMGVEFRLGTAAARYVPGDGLKLADGSQVDADLVVVSAGVRARTGLAEAAGLDVDRGVLVDDALRTSDGRVHAIGDCAQHPGTISGLVAPAWEQAEALAALLTGADTATRYRGTPVLTRLKADGVDLASLGEALTEVSDDTAEVLRLSDPARGRYGKLVIRDDRVTGAILLGCPDAAATITQLYDRGVPVPEDRLALLLGRAVPADEPASAVVCRCNSVTKERLVEAYRDGATTMSELAAATRATTGCGGCADAVRQIVDSGKDLA